MHEVYHKHAPHSFYFVIRESILRILCVIVIGSIVLAHPYMDIQKTSSIGSSLHISYLPLAYFSKLLS